MTSAMERRTDPEPDRRSTFRPPSAPEQPTVGKIKNMKKKILLVSAVHGEQLIDVLEDRGYEVYSADTGRKATQLLISTPVCAIVLDHTTPFDGIETDCSGLRTIDGLTDIDAFVPLLLICGSDEELDHPTTMMADLILRQPVSKSALLEALDTLLSESFKERVLRKAGPVAGFR